ncbi:MAG TPA: hypothetical protein VHO67_08490 [Polyangia bacterium]|nr:hypothetical protein [Polyangia bacterium]
MKTGGLVVAVVLWAAAGSARADNPQGGLAGLDAAMNRPGRVGDLSPRAEVPVGAARIPDGQTLGNAPKGAIPGGDRDERALPQSSGLSELEYEQTERPVANCRIEVARRRRVTPAQVSAGTVLLRFTIEPSGRVRDAEAVSAANTDLDVAACAKRVLSEWTFAKHAAGNIQVERSYRVGDGRFMGRADKSMAAVSP